MDALALRKTAFTAGPAHGEFAPGLQVHLDARGRRVEKSHVRPVVHGKVAAQHAVDVQQQVLVEGRRHAQRVVVGCLQHVRRLEQVHPDQQAATLRRRADLAQEDQRLLGGEVADARARVEQQARALAHLGRQGQLRGKVQPHAQHVQRGELALQALQGVVQVVHRDVHRHVTRRLQQAEQPRRLLAVAGPQVHQRGALGHFPGDRGTVREQQGGFGARGVVLGQLGNGVEQARAQRVVEVFGRGPCRRGQQAPGQFLAQRRAVFVVELEETRLAQPGG